MKDIHSRTWSPYAVGVGIGVLSWFAFATADHGLGITTAFEHTAALVERAIAPASATGAYFAKEKAKIDWGWMVVVGVLLGSFLSSKLSGDRGAPTVPAL